MNLNQDSITFDVYKSQTCGEIASQFPNTDLCPPTFSEKKSTKTATRSRRTKRKRRWGGGRRGQDPDVVEGLGQKRFHTRPREP